MSNINEGHNCNIQYTVYHNTDKTTFRICIAVVLCCFFSCDTVLPSHPSLFVPPLYDEPSLGGSC